MEKTILLIADDLLFVSRVRESAKQMEMSVTVAGTENATLAALQSEPLPAVILVSLAGRRFDPLAVIRTIKADETAKYIPLLAFAGHAETEKHVAAREAGADRTAANSSVSGHLPALLARLLAPESKNENPTDVLEIEND